MTHTIYTENRPWGQFEIIVNHNNYKVKRIIINPGKRLSLQRHKNRSEHWFFVEGKGIVTINNNQIIVEQGSSVDIKCNEIHRVENTEHFKLVFIEIQTGEYLGEDDIERIEDDFGR